MWPIAEIIVFKPLHLEIPMLFKNVHQKEAFAFGKIFELLANPKSASAKALIELALGCKLDPFIEESKKKFTKKPKEFSRLVMKMRITTNPWMEIRWSVLGKGNPIAPNDCYSLSFCKINSLKKIPVTFDEQTEIFFKKKMVDVKSTSPITVLNFFLAILDDLTFDGDPVTRDKRAKDIRKRIKDVDSGKVKFYPWSKVKRDLKKKVKKWAADAEEKKKSSKKP